VGGRAKGGGPQGIAGLEELIIYKPTRLPHFLQTFRRRIYVDIGANTYESSIGSWFLRRYPHARHFDQIVAFEANRKFRPTYAPHPEVELLSAAAWMKNGTIRFRGSKHGGGSGRVEEGSKAIKLSGQAKKVMDASAAAVQAIDLADFLRRRVAEQDFLVLKMDVEGAEYTLVPYLIAQGVTHLIDEMFVELHTDLNICCKPPNDAGRHFEDAMRLVGTLRDAGVYVHPWG